MGFLLPFENVGNPPLEEGVPATPLPEPDFVVFLTSDEEFAGSMPAEEGSPTPVVTDDDRSIVSSFSEDFAGSLPAFESNAWQIPTVFELPNDQITFAIGEDFAGSLPREENAPNVFVEVPLDRILASIGEDFAGSLSADDPHQLWTPAADPDWITFAIGEDFAGSSVLDEPAIVFLIERDRDAILISVDEGFAGALALDEPGSQPPIELVRDQHVASVDEDFAGSGAFGEEHGLPPTIFEPPFLVPPFDVEEVFPQPLPPPSPAQIVTVRRAPAVASGGGNAVFLTPVEMKALPKWVIDSYKEEQVADFAIMHVRPPDPVGALVKALAGGTVESFVDEKSRKSIVLNAEDGTRYWYADVGESLVEHGMQVRVGQIIARTKPNAPPIPKMIEEPKVSLVLVGPENRSLTIPEPELELPPPPPAQVVFVEPPPKPEPIQIPFIVATPMPPMIAAPPVYEPYPTTVPEPESNKEWPVTPPQEKPNLLKALAPIGGLAAILLAVSVFLPPKEEPKRTKRKKKR